MSKTLIRIAWFNSLILAVAGVAVGMHQSVFLVRVGSVSNSDMLIRGLLIFECLADRRIPYWDQDIIWQTAVGLLECSIYFWLGGYVVFIWDLTKLLQEQQQRSDRVVWHLWLNIY